MANFDWVPEEYQGVFSYVNNKLMASCVDCGTQRHTSGRGAVLRDIGAGKGDKFRYCGSCRYVKSAKPTKEEIASWPPGHKRCVECRKIKPFSGFHKHAACLFGYNTVCKDCRVPKSKQKWLSTDYRQRIYDRAKGRAKQRGREFTISLDDVVIPETCPVLGVPLVHAPGSPYVPSLDRIDSSKGYTPDNIIVMSWRANTLKNNMTEEECRALLRFFEGATVRI